MPIWGQSWGRSSTKYCSQKYSPHKLVDKKKEKNVKDEIRENKKALIRSKKDFWWKVKKIKAWIRETKAKKIISPQKSCKRKATYRKKESLAKIKVI